MAATTKTAIVTGAGSGIGRAVTVALAGRGFAVVLAGRRQAALDETLMLLGSARASCRAVAADVTDEAAVDMLFARTQADFGRLDLLFNNAGVSAPGVLLEDISAAQWSTVLAVNLTGVFLCTRAAFRLMKAQQPRGGRIINNGSISAHVPRPNSAPYTASKHAITGLTRSTALDGRKYDIACGQIDIGNAETNMASAHGSGVVQANGDVISEPMLNPQIVADAVVNMANLPLEANVQFMTVMATKMPYIGRG